MFDTCNGDATSLEQFHLPTMKLFSGKLMVLVQSLEEAVNIELSIKGLQMGMVSLTTAR